MDGGKSVSASLGGEKEVRGGESGHSGHSRGLIDNYMRRKRRFEWVLAVHGGRIRG